MAMADMVLKLAQEEISRLRDRVAELEYSIEVGDAVHQKLRDMRVEDNERLNQVITRAELAEAGNAKLVEAYRNADEIDWGHLDKLLGYSGHGQFWRAIFKEVRAALSNNMLKAHAAGIDR